MLLMIDNYDSFTYNVVQYLGELGAEVQVFRNDAISVAEIEQLAPQRLDGVPVARLGGTDETARRGGARRIKSGGPQR